MKRFTFYGTVSLILIAAVWISCVSLAHAQVTYGVPSNDCYQIVYVPDAKTGVVRKFERRGPYRGTWRSWEEHVPQAPTVSGHIVKVLPGGDTAARQAMGAELYDYLNSKSTVEVSQTLDLTGLGYTILGAQTWVPPKVAETVRKTNVRLPSKTAVDATIVPPDFKPPAGAPISRANSDSVGSAWDWSPASSYHKNAVSVYSGGNMGSGAYVHYRGFTGVLTAAHVQNGSSATATFQDGVRKTGMIWKDVHGHDVAFLVVRHDSLKPLDIAAKPVSSGDRVEVMGYGGPRRDSLRHYHGEVLTASRTRMTLGSRVVHGDSGGPVLNSLHQVVGVCSTGAGGVSYVTNSPLPWVYRNTGTVALDPIRQFVSRVHARYAQTNVQGVQNCPGGMCGMQPGPSNGIPYIEPDDLYPPDHGVPPIVDPDDLRPSDPVYPPTYRIEVGEVTTLDPEMDATAVIEETSFGGRLHLGLPRGYDGANGRDGIPGPPGPPGETQELDGVKQNITQLNVAIDNLKQSVNSLDELTTQVTELRQRIDNLKVTIPKETLDSIADEIGGRIKAKVGQVPD